MIDPNGSDFDDLALKIRVTEEQERVLKERVEDSGTAAIENFVATLFPWFATAPLLINSWCWDFPARRLSMVLGSTDGEIDGTTTRV